MLKDLGRGGIRLQRPQAGAVKSVFRPSLARVPPNTASTSRPPSAPSSAPLSTAAPSTATATTATAPVLIAADATTATATHTTATTTAGNTTKSTKPRPASVLSFDAQALDSDDEDDVDEDINNDNSDRGSRAEGVTSLLEDGMEEEEEFATQTQPLRSSLEAPSGLSQQPRLSSDNSANHTQNKAADKTPSSVTSQQTPAESNAKDKAKAVSKTNTQATKTKEAKNAKEKPVTKSNPKKIQDNVQEDGEFPVNKKAKRKVVEDKEEETNVNKKQKERQTPKRKQKQSREEGEGEGSQPEEEEKEGELTKKKTTRKVAEDKEGAGDESSTKSTKEKQEKTRTPMKRASKNTPKRKKKSREEEEEEDSEEFVSDYEDDIKPKRKKKATSEKKKRVTQKKKKEAEDEEDEEVDEDAEEGKQTKKKVLTPANKKFETHKPIEKRTLKAIIRDHYSGEVSASSLREKTTREAKQAKVEELDESVTKEEKEVAPRPPPRNQDYVAAPQVQIIDGKVVISQESLAIHADVGDTSGYTQVEEIHRRVTGATYSKRIKATKWTEAETEVFFRAVAMYGTDFTFVSQLLPRRSRKEVRNKFKREQSADPAKMDAIMMSKTPMDFDEFEAALERVKKEAAQKKAKTSGGNEEGSNKQKDEDEEDDDDCIASEATAARARPQSVDVNSDDDETTTKAEVPSVDSGDDEGADIAVDELEADLSWAAEETSFPEVDEEF